MRKAIELVKNIHDDHSRMMKLLEKAGASLGEDRISFISEVVDHLSIHFCDEESCMKVYHYPNLAKHEIAHEALQDGFIRILKARGSIEHANLSELQTLLIRHILEDDEEFMQYLETQE